MWTEPKVQNVQTLVLFLSLMKKRWDFIQSETNTDETLGTWGQPFYFHPKEILSPDLTLPCGSSKMLFSLHYKDSTSTSTSEKAGSHGSPLMLKIAEANSPRSMDYWSWKDLQKISQFNFLSLEKGKQ